MLEYSLSPVKADPLPTDGGGVVRPLRPSPLVTGLLIFIKVPYSSLYCTCYDNAAAAGHRRYW